MLGSTGGLVERFGSSRVRNTPISEAGFVGAAAGAAMTGMRPVVDMMIAPFLYCAMDQVVSVIAKSTYLYGGQTSLPLVLRATMFYDGHIGAQHSDRPISTFMTIPGLKIIAPSNAYDVKGLLKSAIREDDPVISFEDRNLWSSAEDVPDDDYVVPLGVAEVKREGTDVTVVAISGTVRAATDAADRLAGEGVSAEVIDPRTLVPLDLATIVGSVERTGALVVAHEAVLHGGFGAELAARVQGAAFEFLDAPIARVGAPFTPVPFSAPLEDAYLPGADEIVAAVRGLR
jgi:pyruvate dehydrogenase E1 component beta subunit